MYSPEPKHRHRTLTRGSHLISIAAFLSEHKTKGFLAIDEGEALYRLALTASKMGPCLEIGSYCGKSTVYMGMACKQHQGTLYAVDHHQGSEEHQIGEAYHDADLFNTQLHCMDSFPSFRQTMRAAGLVDTVVPVVTHSETLRRHWQTPLSMVFIDGGHSEAMAINDCTGWAKHILPGGYLAVHDIFPDPADGGQGPWMGLNAVLKTKRFELIEQVNSLGVLRRRPNP